MEAISPFRVFMYMGKSRRGSGHILFGVLMKYGKVVKRLISLREADFSGPFYKVVRFLPGFIGV